jgi:hypothetical protein
MKSIYHVTIIFLVFLIGRSNKPATGKEHGSAFASDILAYIEGLHKIIEMMSVNIFENFPMLECYFKKLKVRCGHAYL